MSEVFQYMKWGSKLWAYPTADGQLRGYLTFAFSSPCGHIGFTSSCEVYHADGSKAEGMVTATGPTTLLFQWKDGRQVRCSLKDQDLSRHCTNVMRLSPMRPDIGWYVHKIVQCTPSPHPFLSEENEVTLCKNLQINYSEQISRELSDDEVETLFKKGFGFRAGLDKMKLGCNGKFRWFDTWNSIYYNGQLEANGSMVTLKYQLQDFSSNRDSSSLAYHEWITNKENPHIISLNNGDADAIITIKSKVRVYEGNFTDYAIPCRYKIVFDVIPLPSGPCEHGIKKEYITNTMFVFA